MKTFKEIVENSWSGYHGLGNPQYNPDEEHYDRYDKRNTPSYVKNIKLHSKPELNSDEKNSLKLYVGAGYKHINYSHRNNNEVKYIEGINSPTRAEIAMHTKNLDSAISKHVTKQPIHVWRGIDKKAAKALKLGKNKDILDKGYVSSTVAQHIASGNFKDPKSEEHHIMSIRVPKGSHAIYMNQHSKSNVDEHEVLLPRNSKFKYSHSTEHTHRYGYKVTVHHLTHIPEGSNE